MSPDYFHPLSIRLAASEDFAAARDVLRRAGFTTEGVCRRLQIAHVHEFKSIRQNRQVAVDLDQPVDVMIRLFLDCDFVPESRAAELLGVEALAALGVLGLLGRSPAHPGRCFGTVAMYPVRDLLLISDRADNPDGSPYRLPVDVVYPALVENTRQFMDILPGEPCGAMLDLGTGTGVAALLAASSAGHAWGTDIARRAVTMAEFNRRLNGIANATMLEGDLYGPVGDLTFDRIVAHPPYVPTARPTFVFRDGGEDGEQITRRIIEGLPRHLRPEGRFYCLTLGADLEGEPFENRIRKWLGEAACQFDIVMVLHYARTPAEFVIQSFGTRKLDAGELQFWRESFARRKVERLCYASLLIRRTDGTREGFTSRVHKGGPYGAAETGWLLDWETGCRRADSAGRLLDSPLRMAPECELVVASRMRGGSVTPERFLLQTDRPFSIECRCQPWVAELVAASDGSLTGRQHYQRCLDRGTIPEGTAPDEFVSFLRYLVGAGIIEVPYHPLPVRSQTSP